MEKKSLMKSLLAGGLILVFTATSCSSGGTKHDHSSHAEGEHAAAAEAPAPGFEDPKVEEVYQHYIHLKDALVASDAAEAKPAAAALQTALTDAGSTAGADLAGKIASTSDIKAQRSELDALTAEVEGLIKSAKLASGKIFKQHCPMANEGKGGYWLASEKAIKNPYYGDEMMTCGSVEAEIN